MSRKKQCCIIMFHYQNSSSISIRSILLLSSSLLYTYSIDSTSPRQPSSYINFLTPYLFSYLKIPQSGRPILLKFLTIIFPNRSLAFIISQFRSRTFFNLLLIIAISSKKGLSGMQAKTHSKNTIVFIQKSRPASSRVLESYSLRVMSHPLRTQFACQIPAQVLVNPESRAFIFLLFKMASAFLLATLGRSIQKNLNSFSLIYLSYHKLKKRVSRPHPRLKTCTFYLLSFRKFTILLLKMVVLAQQPLFIITSRRFGLGTNSEAQLS